MKRVLSGLTCAVVICSALVPASHADDALIAAMELEIRIQELSKKVYEQAKKQAWKAAKQTTLWQQWREAKEKNTQASKARISLLEQKLRVSNELSEYRRAFMWNWYKDYKDGRRSGWWETAIKEDPRAQELLKQKDALGRKHLEASITRSTLLDASRDKFKKLNEIVKKFTRRLYFQEIEKRLTELQIEITKEVQKKIEQSYQLHSA